MANTWMFQRIPTEFKADFQYALATENVRLIFIGLVGSGINHLGLLWIDWQRYQEGLFAQVPAYRWLFYSNASWWLVCLIIINIGYNWPRIKNKNYPIQQLVWKIDFALFFHVISVTIRIALLANYSLLEAFATYLLLVFTICFFCLDVRRRFLLFSIPLCVIVLIYAIYFQDLKLLMAILYCFFAAFFAVAFSNVFYVKLIKQLLVEKELESKNLQLLEQGALLEQKNQLIEAQKSLIGDELKIARHHLAATLLMMAEKENLLNSLKKDLMGLDTSNPSTITAKGKIVKKIEESILNEGQWDLFQQQFEQIEPHFVKNLIQNFPKITQKDLKLLILIRMNLESREIGDIIGISLKSVNTARYRLRKRLELSEEENLELFVHCLK
jgi:hypothetical protein